MSEILDAIWAIVFLVTIFGFIPYGVLLISTAVKKRWKQLGRQLGIPLAVFLVLYAISFFVNIGAQEQYLEDLYDTKVNLEDPIFEYRSKRSFQGDGYSISVYELPASIRTRFEAADTRLLSEFPKHPSYRDHWNFTKWKQTPVDDSFDEYLNFALSGYGLHKANGLSEHFDSIRKILSNNGGAYYAIFYNSPHEHLGDIDLFIVDLIGNRLYSINHNT